MYSVKKKFKFNYAHRLHLMGKSHACSNLHGHEGILTLEIRKRLLPGSASMVCNTCTTCPFAFTSTCFPPACP